jgi:hypothetical protein
VKAHCIDAFSGVWVNDSMDRVNLESSDLKGYTLIAVGFVMMCIADEASNIFWLLNWM